MSQFQAEVEKNEEVTISLPQSQIKGFIKNSNRTSQKTLLLRKGNSSINNLINNTFMTSVNIHTERQMNPQKISQIIDQYESNSSVSLSNDSPRKKINHKKMTKNNSENELQYFNSEKKQSYTQIRQEKLLKDVQYVSSYAEDKFYQDYHKCDIKPGLNFLKIFIANSKREKPFKLNINFPMTIGLFHEKFLIYTNDQVKETDFLYKLQKKYNLQIEQIVEKGFKNIVFEDNIPIMLHKKVETYQLNQTCLTYENVGQQYIIPSGLRASVYRYHYYNSSYNTSNKQSYVYLLANQQMIDLANDKLSATLNLENYPTSTQIYKILNMNSFQFDKTAEQLVTFIQKHYVADWMQSLQNPLKGLRNLKYFGQNKRELYKKSDQKKQGSKVYVSADEKRIIDREGNYSNLMQTLQNQIQFTSHLRKRGVFTFEQQIPTNPIASTEATSLICDLCYMLIVAELELINIEEQFAVAFNIPQAKIQYPLDAKLKESSNTFQARKGLMVEDLPYKPIQWRVLIYLRNFVNIDMNQFLKNSTTDIYVQVRLFDKITKMKWLSKDHNQMLNQNQNQLNFVRLHYFFSLPSENIQKFLMDGEIEIRVTDGPSFSKQEPLLVGQIHAFRNFHFKDQLIEKQSIYDFEYHDTKREYFNVQLFSKKMSSCSVSIVVGLKKDYESRSEKLQLQNQLGVYVPLDEYYNCDPLPQTWIEMFEESNTINIESFINPEKLGEENQRQEEIDLDYYPVQNLISYEERLAESKVKSSQKFDHIESKLMSETFTTMEKKRINLLTRIQNNKSLMQRSELSSAGFNQSGFNSSRSQSSAEHPKKFYRLKKIKLQRSYSNFGFKNSQNDQDQQKVEYTDQQQSELDLKDKESNRFENESQSQVDNQLIGNDTFSRKSQVKQIKTLKKIKSLEKFHQSQTRSLIPYLNTSQVKNINKVIGTIKHQSGIMSSSRDSINKENSAMLSESYINSEIKKSLNSQSIQIPNRIEMIEKQKRQKLIKDIKKIQNRTTLYNQISGIHTQRAIPTMNNL
ncbi:UNKNOWN [Stylonychia lemnae]|uniref:Uncharacterized protein n=1 Tax=Stylonychia lemnae TaxID=5949 RepID=A0A078AH38_STYLE|nr:UNKNOWN [Stylonychia lemnae]|eukprot:CDW81146.1 UNKNOWN [Stylonychia lemnae]